MRLATSSTVKKLTPVSIAAGSIEAGHEPLLDRVAARAENDRNCGGSRLGCECGSRTARCDDHAHLAKHEIGGQFGEPPVLALRPVEFERYVLAHMVAALSEAFAESGHLRRSLGGRAGIEEPDHRHLRLLRACRERPCRGRAAEKADKLTSPHCRTQAQGTAFYRLRRVL